MKRLALAAAFAALFAGAAAQAQAPAPEVQRVEFDVPTPAGPLQKINGFAFTPGGPAPTAPLPAVIILHGSEGVSDAREGLWGSQLAALGMVVLVVDSFGPRGVKSTVDDQSRVTTGQMIGDAFGALDFLSRQKFVDPKRIALMGMSKGGGAVLLVADQRSQRPAQSFAAFVPLYPFCSTQYRAPQLAGPMLMLLGETDDYTGARPCADYAERMRKAGGRVEVKVYPGAPHGFDGASPPVRLAAAQSFRDCVMMIENDGRTVLEKTGQVLDTPQKALEALKRDCMRTGATAGGHEPALKQALEDVKAFLKTHLLR